MTAPIVGDEMQQAGVQRPICYDVSHFASRIGDRWHSGIDNVDHAYVRHFAGRSDARLVHCAMPRPHVVAPAVALDLVRLSSRANRLAAGVGSGRALSRVRATPTDNPMDGPRLGGIAGAVQLFGTQLAAKLRRLQMYVPSGDGAIPHGAIYLNVTQYLLERGRLFDWLHRRPDVLPVFLLHDLLPLDYPEFWLPSEVKLFPRRFDTAFKYGKAFIVTSESVKQRVLVELARRNLEPVPVLVAPLPSPLGDVDAAGIRDPALAATSYFVTIGTIEPRKNHLLLLAIWRRLAEAAETTGELVPKLVIVGGRGWENEQVLDVLDRGRLTRPHVIEASRLAPSELARLIANARALLMPSFAEGYGFPLVEALSLGTPVVATDAPVFREVTQGCAIYRDAIDGVGWREIIRKLTDSGSVESLEARDAAARFVKPDWSRYFETVDMFLAGLKAAR